jgi:type V secretory pathway adhesin AidA
MAQEAVKTSNQETQKTQNIAKEQWTTFLTEFTRENRGAHARLEVLGPDVGYQVQTDDRPFDGVSADTKDAEDAVWIAFGSGLDDHFTHGIQNVTAIRVRPPVGESGAALEIVAGDGTTTLLELTPPGAYSLPSAGPDR